MDIFTTLLTQWLTNQSLVCGFWTTSVKIYDVPLASCGTSHRPDIKGIGARGWPYLSRSCLWVPACSHLSQSIRSTRVVFSRTWIALVHFWKVSLVKTVSKSQDENLHYCLPGWCWVNLATSPEAGRQPDRLFPWCSFHCFLLARCFRISPTA